MRSITILIFFVAVVIFSINIIEVNCQSVSVAEIIHISGIVKIKSSSAAAWIDAEVGMKVKEGDLIKTEANSSAELAFGEELSNVINVFADSQLVISKFEPGLAKLEEGRVFSLIKGLKKGSTFEIRTPTAVTGARGTGWGVFLQGLKTEVSDFEEAIYCAGLDEEGATVGLTDLIPGLKAFIPKGKGPKEFLNLSEEEKGEWGKWKKEAERHVVEYKQQRGKEAAGGESGEDKLEKLEKRTRMLNRVEQETTRAEEIKRERRTQGGTSQIGKEE